MMCKLTEFEIYNFKKFAHLKLTNLSKINLLFGINNVGKTTILEAVFAYACGANVSAFVNSVIPHRMTSRQLSNPYQLAEAIWDMFHNNELQDKLAFSFNGTFNDKKIEVQHKFAPSNMFAGFIPNSQGVFDETEVTTSQTGLQVQVQFGTGGIPLQIQRKRLGKWEISVSNQEDAVSFDIDFPNMPLVGNPRSPLILAQMNDILEHKNEAENLQIYSTLARAQLLDEVIKGMNKSFAGLNLKSIENIPYPDGSQASLSCRFQDNHLLPMYMLGDGVRRWFNIIGNMVFYKNAIHCIEEIDVNFHHQAQGALSKQLFLYSQKFHNQIFATSHSEEYLRSFLTSLQELGQDGPSLADDIRIITLRDVGGEIRARTLNGEEALSALDNGLELRV